VGGERRAPEHLARAPGRAAEVLIRYVAGEYVSPRQAFELILPADIQVESVN
jgi:hypothetical protein